MPIDVTHAFKLKLLLAYFLPSPPCSSSWGRPSDWAPLRPSCAWRRRTTPEPCLRTTTCPVVHASARRFTQSRWHMQTEQRPAPRSTWTLSAQLFSSFPSLSLYFSQNQAERNSFISLVGVDSDSDQVEYASNRALHSCGIVGSFPFQTCSF